MWTKAFWDSNVCDSLQHNISILRACFRDSISVCCKEWTQSMGFNSYFCFRSIAFHCCLLPTPPFPDYLSGNNFQFTENLQTDNNTKICPLAFTQVHPNNFTPFVFPSFSCFFFPLNHLSVLYTVSLCIHPLQCIFPKSRVFFYITRE